MTWFERVHRQRRRTIDVVKPCGLEGCDGFVRFTGAPGFDNVLRGECTTCGTRWSLAQGRISPIRAPGTD